MSRPRRKVLSEHDRAEWAAYARRVVALPGRAATLAELPPPPVPPEPIAPASRAEPPPPVPRAIRFTVAVGAAPAGLDRSSWNRLRTGRLPVERTLDLHGRTAQAAHGALHGFLHAAHADGVRCVEVITGRGSGEGGGVIRREFPLWLNSPTLRPLILAASHPHAANTGSVRLLIRRRR